MAALRGKQLISSASGNGTDVTKQPMVHGTVGEGWGPRGERAGPQAPQVLASKGGEGGPSHEEGEGPLVAGKAGPARNLWIPRPPSRRLMSSG